VKYNIALVPHNRQIFIDYAGQSLGAAHQNSYLIGEQSLPHITLCHFLAEPDQIPMIWQAIEAQQLQKTNLFIRLAFIRSKSYSGSVIEDGSWVSLIPNHLFELNHLHQNIAKIIKHPTNAAWAHYDPHLTLFNTKDLAGYQAIATPTVINPPFEEHFSLVLGTSDAVGQLTSILYPSNVTT